VEHRTGLKNFSGEYRWLNSVIKWGTQETQA